MFTGIVQGKARVKSMQHTPALATLTLEFPPEHCTHLITGASIAIEGCCLTVVAINNNQISFNLIQETLERTSLGPLKPGDEVNFERSARFGDEIGGHIVSGHVHGVAKIYAIDRPTNNCIITLELPHDYIKYVFPKGFITLAGCSLTIVDVDKTKSRLTVHLIPETLARTTWSLKHTNDCVNFEVDAQTITIVETIATYLNQQ